MPSPVPAPPPPLSSIDFVTSGIYVDNLQNVAILEYRSSKTGDVVRQYPDQAQINAFKAAERLAQLAETTHKQQAAEASSARIAIQQSAGSSSGHASAPVQTPSAPATGAHIPAAHVSAQSSSSGAGGSSSGGASSTVSIIA